MDETGEIIRELRHKAGFSQKTLANALHITDKAVSKWERGICLPDVSLLPKLALLLDTDVDVLICNSISQDHWVGVIDICDCDFSQKVYDKPLVYYLLSHYLLLNITHIYVLTTARNREYLEAEQFRLLGFDFTFEEPSGKHMMIINHPWFVFGSDLTQQFQGAMLSRRNVKLIPQNQMPIVYFACDDAYFKDKNKLIAYSSARTLGRGMICFDMSNADQILEVASFVSTYQKNTGLLIGSLEEIAYNKGIISDTQLIRSADQVSYGALLKKMLRNPLNKR